MPVVPGLEMDLDRDGRPVRFAPASDCVGLPRDRAEHYSAEDSEFWTPERLHHLMHTVGAESVKKFGEWIDVEPSTIWRWAHDKSPVTRDRAILLDFIAREAGLEASPALAQLVSKLRKGA